MELQRILAKDSRSAMEQVHHKYGKDALIVSNKRAKNKTELIVAVDLDYSSESILDELQVQGEPSRDAETEQYPDFDQVMESKIFKTIAEVPPGVDRSRSFMSDDNVSEKRFYGPDSEQREQLHAREIVDLVKEEVSILRREL